MNQSTTILVALVLSCLAACSPFSITTPDGMIALSEPAHSVYDYRATTPEGVVISARQVRMKEGGDVPPADLEFWAEATRLRLRTTGAYALIDESPARSRNGVEGVQMQFGRDDNNNTYRYDVTLFVTDKFVHIVEAGGEASLFDEASTAISQAVASYVVKR